MKKVFLFGSGISRSISPAIHNKAFRELGLNMEYELKDVPTSNFRSALDELASGKDIVGFNVTIPFKERVLPMMSHLEQYAKEVGAVNVVTFTRKREMIGYNTDVDGVVASLSKLGLVERTGQKAVVLGAGGASRACVYALLISGFDHVKILNRTKAKAADVAGVFKLQFPDKTLEYSELTRESLEQSHLEDVNLLVNTIPFSVYFPFDVKFGLASRETKYFDLNYRSDLPMIKEAKKAGLVTIDGLLMLVEQAARSFEIWTVISAPRKTMLLTAKKGAHH